MLIARALSPSATAVRRSTSATVMSRHDTDTCFHRLAVLGLHAIAKQAEPLRHDVRRGRGNHESHTDRDPEGAEHQHWFSTIRINVAAYEVQANSRRGKHDASLHRP